MAGFPVAQGVTDHTGVYIPEVWSSRLQVKFYKQTCLSEICNTDYEGEIKDQGSEVKIRTRSAITTAAYTKGGGYTVQQPNGSVLTLVINKGRAYAYPINPIDEKQSDIKLIDEWAVDAADQMKQDIEEDLFENVYGDAHASNSGSTAGADSSGYNLGVAGTPLGLTRDNVLEMIQSVGSVLSEQSVPETDRWIVLPVWACHLIKQSDLKDAGMTGDNTSPLRTGRIGMIDGMTIYRNRNLNIAVDSGSGETCTNIIAGHPAAITFATQLTVSEVIDNPDDFGKIHRGLQVYGYKVVKPEALVHVLAYKA